MIKLRPVSGYQKKKRPRVPHNITVTRTTIKQIPEGERKLIITDELEKKKKKKNFTNTQELI